MLHMATHILLILVIRVCKQKKTQIPIISKPPKPLNYSLGYCTSLHTHSCINESLQHLLTPTMKLLSNICHDKDTLNSFIFQHQPASILVLPFPAFLDLTPRVSLLRLPLVTETPLNFPTTTILQKTKATLQPDPVRWARFVNCKPSFKWAKQTTFQN